MLPIIFTVMIRFMVTRRLDTDDQYGKFDYDKDKDQFQIRQMGGYRIDQEEALKAGMRLTSRLARARNGCLYGRW